MYSLSLIKKFSVKFINKNIIFKSNQLRFAFSTKNRSAKDDVFYGIPITKATAKNKEDLIKKFEYVNNFEDMVDLFKSNEGLFSSDEMSKYLERLN